MDDPRPAPTTRHGFPWLKACGCACLLVLLLLGGLFLAGGVGMFKLFSWAAEQEARRADLDARLAKVEADVAALDSSTDFDEAAVLRYLDARAKLKAQPRPRLHSAQGDLDAVEVWFALLVAWVAVLREHDLGPAQWDEVTRLLYGAWEGPAPPYLAPLRARIDGLKDAELDELVGVGRAAEARVDAALPELDFDD